MVNGLGVPVYSVCSYSMLVHLFTSSREALPGPIILLDLDNEKDILIRPLHSSLLGQRYCFEVLSAGGRRRRCFKCASAAERTRWMEDWRRAVQPSMDNCERTERMLSLWVYEARDLAPKRPYLCELRLDGALYARTTTKPASPGGTIFWGEHFDLKTLPPAEELHVCLVQEEEGQKGASLLASVAIPLKELAAMRQPLEKWYPLGKDRPNLPTLRLRGRYCNIRVLPIVQYKEFAEYLTFHYQELCAGLEHSLSDIVAQPCCLEDSCEVDPSKCAPCDLMDNRSSLQHLCEEVFRKIAESIHSFPAELSEVFSAWQEACQLRNKPGIGHRLISASLFLRFLCPAIMSPSLFGLTQAYPDDATSRTLTLVAKVIQNLANFTTFGEKEAYMGFMNEFLEHNWGTMKSFLSSVSSPGSAIHMVPFDDSIDLALELSVLHSLLCNIFSSLEENQFSIFARPTLCAISGWLLYTNPFHSVFYKRTQERLEPLPTILRAIQEGTPVPVSVRLGPKTAERQAEDQKPGFVPPRDLGKHSPLIKSQSMTSIQKGQRKEEPLAPLHQAKARSKVQRTQSVPTQSKGARRLHKQGSMERMVESSPESDTFSPQSSKAMQDYSKLRPSASLPRKPTVPWLRHSEEVAATQRGLYTVHPLEKAELTTAKEKQKLFQEQLDGLTAQNQMLLEEKTKFQEWEGTLCKRLEEMESCFEQLSSRVSSLEANSKKEHEKLQASKEKTKQLEHRLSGMERNHDQLLRAVSQMLEYRGKTSSSLQQQLSGPVWINRTENGDET
ncbi:hypothetical protein JD844_009981 [Phrynosoma platyrhinos]|uniref:RAS protein activator like 3 n=1 Tax=Phrynosoma platyrhinos TaxID=52577 RepID=A0ABQ7TGN2_PHRPL|nr:hypothetical protein JD844_009981 [Phrynosoma platyrhinos]